MQKWDYKVLRLSRPKEGKEWKEFQWVDTGHLESRVDRLKEMGEDGWELVAVSNFQTEGGSTYSSSFFFKRPLE